MQMNAFGRSVIASLLFGLVTTVHAALDLGQYTFESKTLAASSVATGVAFGNFTKNGTPTLTPQGTFLEVNNWSLAYDPGNYIQYTLHPTSGNQLSLSYIIYQAWRGSESAAPKTLRVEVFLGAVSQGSETYTLPATASSHTFDFTDFSASASDTVSVRFFAYDGTATDKNVWFDNVQTWGTVTAVPEPVNLALAICGLVLGGGALGRRAWLHAKSPRLVLDPITPNRSPPPPA
jgi:hypothetical protein